LKAHRVCIGHDNGLLDGSHRNDREERSKSFLVKNSGTLRHIGKDRRQENVGGRICSTTSRKDPGPLEPGILNLSFHVLELGGQGHRTYFNVAPTSHTQFIGCRSELTKKRLIHRLFYIDPLDGNTRLSGIEEGSKGNPPGRAI
jgi:hypothetical protein